MHAARLIDRTGRRPGIVPIAKHDDISSRAKLSRLPSRKGQTRRPIQLERKPRCRLWRRAANICAFALRFQMKADRLPPDRCESEIPVRSRAHVTPHRPDSEADLAPHVADVEVVGRVPVDLRQVQGRAAPHLEPPVPLVLATQG